MSRFSSLEFESDSDGELRHEPAGAPKDEAHYLRDARAAFEEGDFERALRTLPSLTEAKENLAKLPPKLQ